MTSSHRFIHCLFDLNKPLDLHTKLLVQNYDVVVDINMAEDGCMCSNVLEYQDFYWQMNMQDTNHQ